MDMYLSAQDSFNLQEMLDCDIKCEVDDNFGFDCELPPLDFEEDSRQAWIHHQQGNSNSSFELDFFGNDSTASLMVNPHSIMPLASLCTLQSQQKIIKDFEVKTELKIKSEPSSPLPSPHLSSFDHDDDSQEPKKVPLPKTISTLMPAMSKVVAATTPAHQHQAITVVATSILNRRNSNISTINNNNNSINSSCVRVESPSHITTPSTTTATGTTPTTAPSIITTTTPSDKVRKTAVGLSRKQLCLNEIMYYPKPAYSYSCLIAMALKNSRSGSLPVSEIYNFMCNHFPYFKTAPNGWKNSVRHNLSLNKCFEKIEKPVQGPGGTQRKGCLWAMNPDRAAKMDDEVAKWSRKDPSAIKKAMLYPENLEMLERGEMKVGKPPGESDGEVETEEEYGPDDLLLKAAHLIRGEDQDPEEEEDDGGDDGDDDDGDEEEEGEEDDEPQPIGSDESEDELSRMPPSLQPFEPRLVLAHRFNESTELRLPSNINDCDIREISEELGIIGYEELDASSRTLLGLGNGSRYPGAAGDIEDDSDDVDSESDVPVGFSARTPDHRKRSASTARIGRIQGNYVCVKRKFPQVCRSSVK